MSSKALHFAIGSIIGAGAGLIAGMMLAPRSGSESRAMAADAMNDAWDSAVDSYERGTRVVNDKIGEVRPNVDATTDELRAKVDLARERMDQLREQLNDAISGGNVTPAADVVVENAVEADAEAAEPSTEA